MSFLENVTCSELLPRGVVRKTRPTNFGILKILTISDSTTGVLKDYYKFGFSDKIFPFRSVRYRCNKNIYCKFEIPEKTITPYKDAAMSTNIIGVRDKLNAV